MSELLWIFVGLVRHIETQDIEPLVYANRNFCAVQMLDLVVNS